MTLFVLVTAAGILGGAGNIVRILFPASAFIVAAFLYRANPPMYIGFAWWVWFLTPGIRRLVDYQVGWDPQSPVLLTPLLVSGLTLLGALYHLPKLRQASLFPFGLIATGIVYGYGVGLIRVGLVAATYAFANWIVPLSFGLFIALSWRSYPSIRRTIAVVFGSGVALLGVYGVLQFIAPAPWDAFWMVNSEMNSIGQPLSYEVRVFSLLNSQLPFATVMCAGLLMLLPMWKPFAIPVAIVGSAAFMLSLVRSAWLAFVVGLVAYATYVTWQRRWRLVVVAVMLCSTVTAAVGAATRIASLDTAMESIGQRIKTLTDLSGDVSYMERRQFLLDTERAIVSDPAGKGLGATGGAVALGAGDPELRTFDNGLLDVFYSLGWFGGVCFTLGLAMLGLRVLRREEAERDLYVKAARAVCVATATLALSGPIFGGVTAAVLWGFVGTVIAAHSWSRASARESRAEQYRPFASASTDVVSAPFA